MGTKTRLKKKTNSKVDLDFLKNSNKYIFCIFGLLEKLLTELQK